MNDDGDDSPLARASGEVGSEVADARPRIITVLVFAIVVAVGLFAAFARRSNIRTTEEARRVDAAVGRVHSVIQWEGRIFQIGDRIRIVKRAGTFKPLETGFGAEVEAGPGQVGTILRGERRVSSNYMTIDPAEPIQIVRVKWDAQSWKVTSRDERVELAGFESTIHVSYLESIR